MMHMFRVGAGLFVVALAAFPLAGCTSPTYGTNKTAAEQLLDDVGESIAVGTSKDEKQIAHKPRPDLVVPKSDQLALVEPQESLADRESNPNWVESPEEIRARLLEEAKGQKVGYVKSPLSKQDRTKAKLRYEEQQQDYTAARTTKDGVTVGKSRYLIDPPTKYRTVEDPSVLADLGEPEKKKEKRRKKEAKSAEKGADGQWWDPLDLF